MKNLHWKVLVFILTICCSACFFACNGEEESSPNEIVYTFTLDDESVEVMQYDQVQLTVKKSEALDGEIVWQSANPDIATVDKNGLVAGLALGETEITATVGGYSDTCKITVIPQTEVARIVLDKNETQIYTGLSVSVVAYVEYKGTTVDCELTWESADESVATVDENGLITGVKVGATKVTVVGTYQGETICQNVLVTVCADVNVEPNTRNVSLKANRTIDGDKTETQITYTVKRNKEAYQAESVTYTSDDETVATVSQEGKIVAVGGGETTITLAATVDGVVYPEKINVVVEKSSYNADMDDTPFEVYKDVTAGVPIANTYSIDLGQYGLLADEKTLVYAKKDETQYPLNYDKSADGKQIAISGASFGASVYGELTIVVETNTVRFFLPVCEVVTKYIASETDLGNMVYYGGIDTTTTEKAYDGYFVMTGNITSVSDMTNRGTSVVAFGVDHDGDRGFKGVFDGQGYAIKDIMAFPNNGGIFGNVAKEGVVKNVAFTGEINLVSTTTFGFVLADNFAGRLENVYMDIEVNGESKLANGYYPVARNLTHASLKDVVVKFNAENAPENGKCGYLAGQLGRPVVSSKTWGDCAEFENVHVFSNADAGDFVAASEYLDYPQDMEGLSTYTLEDKANITMTDDSFWYLSIPIFKSVGKPESKIAYMGSTYQTSAFESYSGVTDKTPVANEFSVDLSGYELPTTISGVRLIGDRAEKSLQTSDYSWTNGELKISGTCFGSTVYGKVSLELESDDYVYIVSSFNVVTKYIASETDLGNMVYYGGIDTTTAEKAYDGYYVMTGNITSVSDMTNRDTSVVAVGVDHDGDRGFKGVFDGQGYAIQDIMAFPNNGGIFGNVAKEGVVKNVAFTGDINLTTTFGFILADNFAGRLENVYMDIEVRSGATLANGYYPIGRNIEHADLKDVVIKFDSTNAPANGKCGYLAGQLGNPVSSSKTWSNMATFENVHVFHNNSEQVIDGTTYDKATSEYLDYVQPTEGITVYALDATASVTMTDSTHWDMTGTQPIFASAK